jgi:hypothetical protein
LFNNGAKAMTLKSITELAREFDCLPRVISDAFYSGALDEKRVIRAGGRRLIPADYISEIRAKLIELGKLSETEAARSSRGDNNTISAEQAVEALRHEAIRLGRLHNHELGIGYETWKRRLQSLIEPGTLEYDRAHAALLDAYELGT